jgi:hypothetical protein
MRCSRANATTIQKKNFYHFKIVCDKALIYFHDGKPFTTIKGTYQERLRDATFIRNRVAHNSIKARSDFKKVALRFLGKDPKKDKLHSGYSQGKLLCTITSHGFPKPVKGTVFEEYVALYRQIVDVLTPIQKNE